jgi:probable addiction module antidote protein
MLNENTVLTQTSDYHQNLLASLADKEEAAEYLKIALEEYEEDNDSNAFMLALKNVAQAQGSIGTVAKKTSLDRTHLYRIFSSKGNPRFLTLDKILHVLGFKLSIEPI